ncbi:MAG: HNH endonuclease, partial [Jatrophihabitans sp.]
RAQSLEERSGRGWGCKGCCPENPSTAGRPYARIAGGPGLPDAVALRLACAGRVRTFLERHGERGERHALDVGRSHRLVTVKQYRALLVRHHGCCAHPGCGNICGLEAHHVAHWLHGGRTDLSNLVLLCPRHHHAHHDGHLSIHAVDGERFEFRDGGGHLLPERRDLTALVMATTPVEYEHPDLAPAAATTRWVGQRLDHHYAVSCLATRRDPARQRR